MIQVTGKAAHDISHSRGMKLRKCIESAREYQKINDVFRVALCLRTIQNEKLYLDSEYKDIYAVGRIALKIQRGTVYNYLTVARKFLDADTGSSVFKNGDMDFAIMQLLELKKQTVEEIRGMLDSGVITFDTPAKAIKQIVADIEARKAKEVERTKEESVKPLKDAYETFHVAFNQLKSLVGSDDEISELLQTIMDSVVFLYNENDRLWG